MRYVTIEKAKLSLRRDESCGVGWRDKRETVRFGLGQKPAGEQQALVGAACQKKIRAGCRCRGQRFRAHGTRVFSNWLASLHKLGPFQALLHVRSTYRLYERDMIHSYIFGLSN